MVTDEIGFPDCLKASQINKIMKLTFKNWDENYYFGLLKKMNIPENKEFKTFSRGTKMKTGIAVALSHKPKLLLLDVNCSILFAVYSVYGVREMERNRTAYTAERKKCVSC